MEAVKKFLKIKGVQVGLGVMGIGIVLSNFWTIVGWMIIGGVTAILFAVVVSLIEAYQESQNEK